MVEVEKITFVTEEKTVVKTSDKKFKNVMELNEYGRRLGKVLGKRYKTEVGVFFDTVKEY